jgi:hypothetical protein
MESVVANVETGLVSVVPSFASVVVSPAEFDAILVVVLLPSK